MTILPFQPSDVIRYQQQAGVVVEVKGDRVVVLTADGMTRITNEVALRAMQPVARTA